MAMMIASHEDVRNINHSNLILCAPGVFDTLGVIAFHENFVLISTANERKMTARVRPRCENTWKTVIEFSPWEIALMQHLNGMLSHHCENSVWIPNAEGVMEK